MTENIEKQPIALGKAKKDERRQAGRHLGHFMVEFKMHFSCHEFGESLEIIF